jgi:hypothetical protein
MSTLSSGGKYSKFFGAVSLVMTEQDGNSVTLFRVKHLIRFCRFIDKTRI